MVSCSRNYPIKQVIWRSHWCVGYRLHFRRTFRNDKGKHRISRGSKTFFPWTVVLSIISSEKEESWINCKHWISQWDQWLAKHHIWCDWYPRTKWPRLHYRQESLGLSIIVPKKAIKRYLSHLSSCRWRCFGFARKDTQVQLSREDHLIRSIKTSLLWQSPFPSQCLRG